MVFYNQWNEMLMGKFIIIPYIVHLHVEAAE